MIDEFDKILQEQERNHRLAEERERLEFHDSLDQNIKEVRSWVSAQAMLLKEMKLDTINGFLDRVMLLEGLLKTRDERDHDSSPP